jgi:D-sedoheptulose 7-phosphate isomerase
MTDEIRTYLEDAAEALRQTAVACGPSIERACDILIQAYRDGGKLLLCGNGGSAADCQHMAAELVSRFSPDVDRPPMPAIALTTDTSFLTAYTNDYGYEGVFERQLRAHGKRGDVLLAISTSGNSANVLAAARAARELSMHVIALTGPDGKLAALADVAIAIPSNDTQHMQEVHLAVEHLICSKVEQALYRETVSQRS